MKKAPRTWHLLSNRWNSAITEYALSAARALQAQGCQTLFSSLQGSPAEQRAQAYGLPCASLPSFKPTAIKRLRAYAQELRPDAIFVYGGPETFLSRFLGCYGEQGAVVRFRGQEFRNPPRAALLRLAHAHVSSLITAGVQLQEELAPLLSPKLVACLPLGIDAEAFYYDPPAAEVSRPVEQRPVLLLVGRLDPVKGHAHFLRVFSALLSQWRAAAGSWATLPAPCLHIVGQPANLSEAHLRALVQQQGLSLGSDVLLSCERVPNLRSLMSAATLGVVTSVGSEQICRVAEEFLLCGTPILVSGAGALRDVLFAGAGETYAGRSDEQLVEQLAGLIQRSIAESSAQRQQRAAQAAARYSLTSMGQALLAHLQQLTPPLAYPESGQRRL